MSYIWPLGLVVISNVFYQACTKVASDKMNPFASLTVTYLVSAVISAVLYYLLNKDADLFREYGKINWAPIVLGLVIVGLEVGYLYMYRAGWQISTAQIIQSAILAVFLIFVGFFFFRESVTWNKVVGIAVCLLGLGLIGIK